MAVLMLAFRLMLLPVTARTPMGVVPTIPLIFTLPVAMTVRLRTATSASSFTVLVKVTSPPGVRVLLAESVTAPV